MNKERIISIIKEHQSYFLENTNELGFFVSNLWIYCHKEDQTIWDVLDIKDENYFNLIADLEIYCKRRMGEDRGFKNGLESSTKKTVQDWIMVLKATYPLVYKTDIACLKKMFLSVYFVNPWRDGYLLEPLSAKSSLFYEDVINCENLSHFKNESFNVIVKEIKSDPFVIEYKNHLNQQFKDFMVDELKSDQMADASLAFLGETERYHPVSFDHIKYMPFRTLPSDAEDSYIKGIVNCLQGVYYNTKETSQNRKIAKKEIFKLQERFKNEKNIRELS